MWCRQGRGEGPIRRVPPRPPRLSLAAHTAGWPLAVAEAVLPAPRVRLALILLLLLLHKTVSFDVHQLLTW